MSFLRRFASRIDDWLDRRRMNERGREGQDEPVIVVPYPGFGTRSRLHVRGSIVEESSQEKPPFQGTLLEDLAVTTRRFLAEEIMGATVIVRHGDAEAVCTTDSDGFYSADLDIQAEEGWQEATATLADFPGREQKPAAVPHPFLVPRADARFGVISDLDDTVILTGISEPLRNIRTVVESDAEARVAFPGLAPLYRALQAEGGEATVNPIFYVSSGSWKLYDLMKRFMEINDIPRGPMFMDDWGLDETRWFKSSHGAHKTAMIDRVLETYPELPFILVGDSGQHDAEIYARALRDHGSRILAIWIRDVSPDTRDAEVREVLAEAREAGTAVFVEPDLMEAAAHAATRGWITEEDLRTVRREVEAVKAAS